MSEQLEKIDREELIENVVKEHFSSLQSFEPSDQNYILISLRDMLYTRRLHEMEELEVDIANKNAQLHKLKQCNGEISPQEL